MSVSFIGQYTVSDHCKVFKIVLPSLSVNAVSVPTANIANVTTTPTHQYRVANKNVPIFLWQ